MKKKSGSKRGGEKIEIDLAKIRARNPVCLSFKHEAEDRGMALGPVWVQYAAQEIEPLVESDLGFPGEKFKFPQWFSKRDALAIAKRLGIPLEEV